MSDETTSQAVFRIVVPFDPARLSNNQRLHWRERARRTRAVKDVARLCWQQAGCPRSEVPVRVSMIVRRGRVIDQDNAITGCKAARDSLFCRAIVPDDSPKWLELGAVRFETGKRWQSNPEVEFVVTPLGERVEVTL